MKQVTRFQSDDGRLFLTEQEALHHEQRVTDAQTASMMFQEGCTLLEALQFACRVGGYFTQTLAPHESDVLSATFHTTGISIPHWQCRNEPGYHVERIEPDGSLFVWGNAGSWSGPYGNKVNVRELVQYIDQMKWLVKK